MTREEAINKVAPRLSHIDKMSVPKKIKWMKDLVHEIYDNFEKRACSNCKHYEYFELNKMDFCLNLKSCASGVVKKDFSCNKWESKDD